jgi:hypothetical protein
MESARGFDDGRIFFEIDKRLVHAEVAPSLS